MKIDYHKLITNKDIEYYHNPFGGITNDEILMVLEPKHSIQEWIELLQNEKPIIIQFVGKKGRGKTTHLSALHQQFNSSDIYYLDRIHKNVRDFQTKIVFIDSIHRIPLFKRLSLWKQKKTSYVITGHRNKNIEFSATGRIYKTYYFKGIILEELKSIIVNRICISSNAFPEDIIINEDILQQLIHKFKDDFRGILNFLYDQFKTIKNGYH
ncbi:hypothetical protein [Aquimarina macrocephali]|uniref:hypothetical protein n=1 Tax=Aquimarina macrocephali TaxID=666563 RepID=UPI003F681839